MKATVILNDRFFEPKIWKLTLPLMNHDAAADLIFHLSNCPEEGLSESQKEILEDYPRTGMRSVSVGDVIVIEDGSVKTVMITLGIGFLTLD
jgi:hypothetical protein